jgi:RNA polymerase sigma-B factor
MPERERLIESHLPLVRSIARRYAGSGEAVEDLIQVGAIALIKASDRFDPARGVPFGTFAAPAIEGEIRRHLGDRAGSVRIPREVRRMTDKLERSRAQLAASLGRSPTLGELAAALGLEQEDVDRALKAERAREPAPAVSEDVGESASDPESLSATTADRLLLVEGAHVLDERERRIVLLRFHADLTEREIAREVGISQAQVSRVLTRALTKLRKELSDENAPKHGGDITERGVIPAPERVPTRPSSSSIRRKTEVFEATESRIGAVGALEEQARGAGEAEPPNEDPALPYHVTVKPGDDDRGSTWTASLDELPGCEAHGSSPEQAVENLRAAMETWLSVAVEDPQVISPPSPRGAKRRRASSHSGRFLVRMPSDLHAELSRAAEREQVSLNRFVTAQLAAAVASSPSPAPEQVGSEASAPAAPPGRKRSLRVLLAANVLVMVLAAAAAVALLVLAIERGV